MTFFFFNLRCFPTGLASDLFWPRVEFLYGGPGRKEGVTVSVSDQAAMHNETKNVSVSLRLKNLLQNLLNF